MVLPIVQRELRTAAKLKATYYGRLPGPAVAMFIILGILLEASEVINSKSFNTTYLIISGIMFMGALMCGIRTADCISSEKRNETLGLLFLTDLKGKDVILGKLAANTTFDIYGLLAVAPVLYMTSFFGGILWVNLIHTIICVLNTLLLSASIGIFISCYSFHQRKASSAAVGLVIFLTAALPGLAFGYRRDPWFSNLNFDWLFLFSPGYAFGMTLPTAAGLRENYFWTATALQFSISIILLCGSSLALPHLWQIKAPKEPWWRRTLRIFFHGTDVQKKVRRFRLLNINPILWITTRNRLEILAPWWLMGLFAVVGAIIAWKNQFTFKEFIPMALGECVILNLIFLVSIATYISRWLLQDRQTGALELIAATPINEKVITRGLWRAVFWQFAPPLLFLLAVELYVFFLSLELANAHERAEITIIVFIIGFVFHVAFVGIGWAALWSAMRAHLPRNAIGIAILRVMVLPFAVFALMNILFHYLGLRRWWGNLSGYFVLGVIVSLHLINLGFILTRTRSNFYRYFRMLAADRSQFLEKHGWGALARKFFG